MSKEYQMKTAKGYDFFEVSSSLQKAIRRCDEEQAFYWAVELWNSGYDEYLWKRLLIMAAEDIGLGDPTVHTHVRSLYESYNWMKLKKDKKNSERLFLTQAILMMVRCKKSRLVDWALNVYWDSHNETVLQIPDYALDIHSRRGRAMGKTINDFFDEGSLLEKHNELPREEEYCESCRVRWNAMEGNDREGNPDPSIDKRTVLMRMGRDPNTGKQMSNGDQQNLFNNG